MNLRARSRFQSRFSYKPILLRQSSKRVELLWFPQDITESCVCDMSGARTRDSGLCCDMGNTWHAWHVTRSSPQLYRKLPTIRVPVTCLLCMWGRGCDSRIVRHTALTCDGPMLSHQEKNFRGAWEWWRDRELSYSVTVTPGAPETTETCHHHLSSELKLWDRRREYTLNHRNNKEHNGCYWHDR